MRRTLILILIVFGVAKVASAQSTSSESQTLQALLSEVRELRHELQGSLTRMQSAQILLSRLQIQQMSVSRAWQHLDDARSKLAEIQAVEKSEAAEIKHYEEVDPNGENPVTVAEANRAKSDLEASTNLEQQRRATETDAEQQLRTEQDKLTALEAQLDEVVKNMGSAHL